MSFAGFCLSRFVQDPETCLVSALEEIVTTDANQQIKSLGSEVSPPNEGTTWGKEIESAQLPKFSLFQDTGILVVYRTVTAWQPRRYNGNQTVVDPHSTCIFLLKYHTQNVENLGPVSTASWDLVKCLWECKHNLKN